MAHRARLSGSQTRGRARAFRRARLAWLPPPRYAVHRGLRIPGLREGDDSPLGISFHQAVQETCGFQRLRTQRLRPCDPNVTSRTRLRRCGEDSSLPSPGTSHAVPVALGNRSVFFCDAVRVTEVPYAVGAVGGLALRSWETAVTSCAGANGFANMMLFGTPLDAQSSASLPLM